MKNDYLHSQTFKPTVIINAKLSKIPLVIEKNERQKLAEFVQSNQNFQNVKAYYDKNKDKKPLCEGCIQHNRNIMMKCKFQKCEE